MSSIVKAKHLATDFRISETPGISEKHIDSSNDYPKPDSVNEQRENLLKKAIEKSKNIEAEANKRAEAIIANAEATSKETKKNAELKGYDDGYLRGLVDGANQAYKAAEEGIDEIGNLLKLIQEEKYQIIKKEEKNLLEISFEIAKKIMRHSVQMDETILEKMIEEVILENDGKIKITVSEYQKTLDLRVDKSLAKKIKNFSKDSKIIFVKEEDMIVIETASGVVDISVPVQLEQLEKAVGHKQ